MTHTYIHAESSARVFGGEPEDFLAIHDWFDASKSAAADFRHRFVRHHDLGILECEQVHGKDIILSSGKAVPVRAVAEQHVFEDTGGTTPTLADWISCITLPSWANKQHATHHQSEMTAEKWGGSPGDYLGIHAWIDAQVDSHGLVGAALRHHAFGIFDAERAFGSVIINSAGKRVPVRYIAEAHVTADCGGRIPSLQDWIVVMGRKIWMSRGYSCH